MGLFDIVERVAAGAAEDPAANGSAIPKWKFGEAAPPPKVVTDVQQPAGGGGGGITVKPWWDLWPSTPAKAVERSLETPAIGAG
ncbi:unnamed protein product, partial [marine sediment metagenome]